MNNPAPYIAIPAGRLLNRLADEQFAISPDIYNRVSIVISTYYPNGLSKAAFATDKRDLCYKLCPLISRTETEQRRFSKIFEEVVREPKPEKLGVIEDGEDSSTGKRFNTRIAILLSFVIMIAAIWLIIVFGSRVKRSTLRIGSLKSDWQTHKFYLDSVNPRDDSVIWQITGYQFYKQENRLAGETLVTKFPNGGRYTVAAFRSFKKSQDSASLSVDIVNANCAIDFSVVKMAGRNITFQNNSPGLSTGIKYNWNFGDGEVVNRSSDKLISHTYANASGQEFEGYKITVTPDSVEGCDEFGSYILEFNESTPLTVADSTSQLAATGVEFQQAPDLSNSLYRLKWFIPFLLAATGSGAAGYVVYLLYLRTKAKTTIHISNDPPLALVFPKDLQVIQERAIQVGESMETWANQLQQREEGTRNVMDVINTVFNTAKKGGYPTIRYRRMKNRPRYLILIDNRSANDQQTRLYTFFSSILNDSQVELETFYFHADPRFCWNDRYPDGIGLEGIARTHNNSNLVLITEGVRLINYERGEISPWVQDTLSVWSNRAILTPVYPENWNYIEAILSTFFVVLPATPDGQLRLKEYLQLETPPSFSTLLKELNVQQNGNAGRGMFNKNLVDVTVADIESFFKQNYGSENQTEQQAKHLLTWAYATAVYNKPNWEMTIAIGKAIELLEATKNLVTTSNMLKMTALPWLKQGNLPPTLKDALLARLRTLNPQAEIAARTAVKQLLESVKPAPGGRAGKELEINILEQNFYLGNKSQQKNNLKALSHYVNSGLINNDEILSALSKQRRPWKLAFGAAMILVALMMFTSVSRTRPIMEAGLLKPIMVEQKINIDSAVIYNNKAALNWISDTIEQAPEIYAQTTMNLVVRSLNTNILPEAIQNAHLLNYIQGQFYYKQNFVVNSKVRNVLDPRNNFPAILEPIKLLDKGWIPTSSHLSEYLEMLADSLISGDSIMNYLIQIKKEEAATPQSSGVRLTFRSDSALGIAVARGTISLQAARVKYNPLLISFLIYVPQENITKILTINCTSFKSRLPQILESLADIDADRMILHSGGSRPPAIEAKEATANDFRVLPKPRSYASPEMYNKQTATIVLPSNSLPNVFNPRQTLREDSALQLPSIRRADSIINETTLRGIPGEYGVLVGNLRRVIRDNTKGFLYMLVEANGVNYRVAVSDYDEKTARKVTADPSNYPIYSQLTDYSKISIPGYEEFAHASPGFYPLRKVANAGGIDYIRNNIIVPARRTTRDVLYSTLQAYIKENGEEKANKILIWGGRTRLFKNDDYFYLPEGSYEIQDVHMNQHSTLPDYTSQNAPWQDGCIVINKNVEGYAKQKASTQTEWTAFFIRFSTQSINNDRDN